MSPKSQLSCWRLFDQTSIYCDAVANKVRETCFFASTCTAISGVEAMLPQFSSMLMLCVAQTSITLKSSSHLCYHILMHKHPSPKFRSVVWMWEGECQLNTPPPSQIKNKKRKKKPKRTGHARRYPTAGLVLRKRISPFNARPIKGYVICKNLILLVTCQIHTGIN